MISETQLKENQECVRRHLQFENAQDMEGTLSTLHPDCIFEDLPLKKVYRGIDGARRYYAELWKAFDITVESRQRHWTLEGNLIAETTFVGPQRSDFLGNAPRGMSIRLPLVVIVTLRISFGRLAHNTPILETSYSAGRAQRFARDDAT